jgi:predicted RNA-binding protein
LYLSFEFGKFKSPQLSSRADHNCPVDLGWRIIPRALGRPPFSLVMSDVMCVVTNHEGKQAGLPFRVDSARLFVMSDVIFIVIVRDCRWCCPRYKARMVRSGRPT